MKLVVYIVISHKNSTISAVLFLLFKCCLLLRAFPFMLHVDIYMGMKVVIPVL